MRSLCEWWCLNIDSYRLFLWIGINKLVRIIQKGGEVVDDKKSEDELSIEWMLTPTGMRITNVMTYIRLMEPIKLDDNLVPLSRNPADHFNEENAWWKKNEAQHCLENKKVIPVVMGITFFIEPKRGSIRVKLEKIWFIDCRRNTLQCVCRDEAVPRLIILRRPIGASLQ